MIRDPHCWVLGGEAWKVDADIDRIVDLGGGPGEGVVDVELGVLLEEFEGAVGDGFVDGEALEAA